MIADFGPIKKGEYFDWIAIDTESTIMTFGMENNDFEPIKVKFRLVPDTTE